MKRISTVLLALAFVVSPFTVSAQTTDISAQVQALLDQLKNLQAQIEALRSAESQVQTARGEVLDTLKLVRSLSQGMSGDDVTALQAILAADPEIYPEGLITGFYGPLTSKAVKNFQRKNGIETLGIVGPKTLVKLNEKSNKLGLAKVEFDDDEDENEDDDDYRIKNNGKILCAKIPPGHLIAPGWLKKNNGERPIIPECQNLPGGISKILNRWNWPAISTPTTTPDNTAPVISEVSATSTASTTATVTWKTNEFANSKTWFATTSPINLNTASVQGSTSLAKDHLLNLTGLATSTTYYYIVVSADASGNTATSSQNSFTTLGE